MQGVLIIESPLVRWRIAKMMKEEFDIDIDYTNCISVLHVVEALTVYENLECFFKDTGWNRDNPELCSEEYLIQNHICRWIKGKLFYFSRIRWGDKRINPR